MEFASIHTHDEFSLLDGAMKNHSMVELAKKQGLRGIAQTNHGNVDGALKHVKNCKEVGIQPILGCEAYILLPGEADLLAKKRIKRNHLTLLVRDKVGLQKLMKALTKGWQTASGLNNFSGIPIETPLEEGWKDHFVILTGCASSPFWKEKGTDWLPKYREVFGDDLYAETMAIEDFPHQSDINRAALATGIKHVITTDAHYCRPEDHEAHQVLLAIGTKQKWTDPNRFKFDSKLNYMRPPEELAGALSKLGWKEDLIMRGLRNTLEVAEKCSFKLGDTAVDLPRVLPEGIDETLWITEQAYKKLSELGLAGNPTYEARLEYELESLIKGGFVRYILLIADLVNWSRRSGIMVGPGRGSVSGSLVCWLVGISQADPIKYGLIFERFTAPGRTDLPDIDLDFEDRKRPLVEQYLREKYGEHNVARVATHAILKGKLALQCVGRVFDLPRQEVQKMCDTIIVRGDADPRASFSIMDAVEQFEAGKEFNRKYPKIVEMAARLEGITKQEGIHAAGLVVAAKDLREGDHCVVLSGKGERVCNWDKKDLEKMGLMKLDVLGLNTLSVLEDTRQMVQERHGKEIVWTEIDLEDPETYEKTITPGYTATCFQIGSRGLQKFCAQLRPKNFKTVVDASSLWRPGCLRSGIVTEYVECYSGKKKPVYLNEHHKEITKDTYGQMVYQEQIMFLLNRLAGMSWSRTDLVRKIISKKGGTTEFMKYRQEFIDGCVGRKTLTEKQAADSFDKLQFFGMYAYNLSISDTERVILKQSGSWRVEELRLASDGDTVLCWDGGRFVETEIVRVHDHGWIESIEVEVEGGATVRCSRKHRFLTEAGYRTAEEALQEGLGILGAEASSSEEERMDLPMHGSVQDQQIPDGTQERMLRLPGIEEGKHSPSNGEAESFKLGNSRQDGQHEKSDVSRRSPSRGHRGENSGSPEVERGESGEVCRNHSERPAGSGIPGAEIEDGVRLSWLHPDGVRSRIQDKASSGSEGSCQVPLAGLLLEKEEDRHRAGWPSSLPEHFLSEELRTDPEVRLGRGGVVREQGNPANSSQPRVHEQANGPSSVASDHPGPDQVRTLACTGRRIVRITQTGVFERMLDLEVAHPSHNYVLANGLISHNSHASTYGMIGVWTAWAKTHYPHEYMCSYLNWGAVEGKEGMSQTTKLDEALREVKRLGIKIDPPDAQLSGARWTIGPKNQLVAPLAEIKGISTETAEFILEARTKTGGSFGTFSDLVANVNRRRVNRGVLHKMLMAGALDSLLGNMLNYWRLWFDELYDLVLSPKKLEEAYGVLAPRLEEEWTLRQAEILDQKASLLRFTEFGGKEFAQFKKFIRQYAKVIDLLDIKKHDGEVWCFGSMTSLKYGYREGFKIGVAENQLGQVGTKGAMGGAYGNFDDGTGYVMAVFLAEFYAKHKETVETIIGKRILLRGKYSQRRHNLIVEEVWPLEDLSAANFRGLKLKALSGSKDGWYNPFRKEVLACGKCDLRKDCAQPVPGSFGQLRAMVVGEAPGFHEDQQIKGFVGPAGNVLWRELRKLQIERDILHVYNVIACRPKDNKFPGLPYIGKCPWLTSAIQKVRPLSILALGNKAMFYFNGKATGISEWNGRTEWNAKANAWVTYCLHPSAVLHDDANFPAFREGLQEFVRVLAEIS